MNDSPVLQALAASDPARDVVADPDALPARALLARTVAQPVPEPRPVPRRRPAAVAAAGAAAVALVFVGVAVLGPSGTVAYATWEATPSAATASALATAETQCAPAAAEGGTERVLEQRGSYVLAVYADDGRIAQCLTGSDVPTAGTSTTGALPAPAGPDDVEVYDAGAQAWGAGDGEVVSVVGAVGDAVTEVSVENEAGLVVEATVQDGWFTAWWPGTSPADSITVVTDSTVVTVPAEQTTME
ncbi:hypothetical protein SAMN04489860_0682 [Paraoerskovia marina]|uniref:Uncharacterized protein n=1 Tax=Paraoerskovia marina TaxID=545619 RepID=A0A1H1P1X1_9CELL|nr:hypothetical protein [Paraoerskovia marina]SDS05183.1 hypothetical protein SAMN04489860_0682 [Paraoerskovia marina]